MLQIFLLQRENRVSLFHCRQKIMAPAAFDNCPSVGYDEHQRGCLRGLAVRISLKVMMEVLVRSRQRPFEFGAGWLS